MSKSPYLKIVYVIISIFFSISLFFFYYPIKNVNVLLVALMAVVFSFMFPNVTPILKSYKTWNRGKQIFSAVYILLFPLLILLSTKGDQNYLLDNSTLTRTGVYIGAYLAFMFGIVWLLNLILASPDFAGERKTKKIMIICYALPPLVMFLIYWIAFYPGGMSPDSLSQWSQAHTGHFDNWHPVMYTWLIMVLTQIHDTPGIVTLAQIFIISAIIGYMGYVMDKFHFPRWMIWVVSIVFAISPVNDSFSIIIWKDILYSSFLLLFTLIFFIIVKTDGDWLKKRSHFILVFIASLGVVFFRNNGFPVFIISMILLMIFYRHSFKRLALLFGSVVIIYFIITRPVFSYLDVTPSDPNEALAIPTQQIAAIVKGNGKMTEEQREYVNKIFPIELWKEKYVPHTVDPIKFSWKDYHRDVIFADPAKYFKTWLSLCAQNPRLAWNALWMQTSLVWQMNPPDAYWMSTYDVNVFPNDYGLKNRVIAPGLTSWLTGFLKTSLDSLAVIWRPANYLGLILLMAFAGYLRNNYRIWIIILPLLLNTASVFAALPIQGFRYLYSTTMIFYLAIFICYLKLPDKKKELESAK